MLRISRSLPWPLIGVTLLILQGCGSAPGTLSSTGDSAAIGSAEALLEEANRSSGIEAAELRLSALEMLLLDERGARVSRELAAFADVAALPAELQIRYALVQATLELQQEEPTAALTWLQGDLVAELTRQAPLLQQRYYETLAQVYRQSGQPRDAVLAYFMISELGAEFRSTSLHDDIWNTLGVLSNDQLNVLASGAQSYELRGWVELARVLRLGQFDIKRELDAIAQWRRIWTEHPASALLPTSLVELQRIWDERPTRLALLLPLQTPAGSALQDGFLGAYYEALRITRDVPEITVFDTSETRNIAPLYYEAVASGAQLIIGPLDKVLVNQLQQLNELPVPTLALNYADRPSPSPANLFQFGLAPEDEMEQAARLAWNAGYRTAAIVAPQTEDYVRLRTGFAAIWERQGGTVVSQAGFTGESDYSEVVKRLMAIDASEARADRLLDTLPRNNMEFTPRRRQDIDFIFLIANPRQGRQLKPTLAFYYAQDIPVFALPAIYDGLQNQSSNRDLDGIIFTDAPWVLNTGDPLKTALTSTLRQVQGPLQRLRAMGVDSFRLYPALQQLSTGELGDVQGTTGTLTMYGSRRIRRELDVARFEDGLVIPYRLSPVASD